MSAGIIGIDPSLTATGICTDDGWWTVYDPDGGDHRLWVIHIDVTMALTGHTPPRLVIMEDLPTHGKGAGKTGMAQGVIRLALQQQQVPYLTVTAATLKKFATGRGNAPKPDLRMELYKRAELDLADDNQVDAWWLHQIGLHLIGAGDRLTLPKTHLEALDKINKPVIA